MIRKITANGIVASAIVGSTRWREGVGRAVELAGQQPVEHEEAGDPGAARARSPGGRTPGRSGCSIGEPVLEQEREEEDRDGDADERHHDRAVVERRAVPLRGQVAERDREHDGEGHRADAQLDRRGQAGQEDVEGVAPGQHRRGGAELAAGRPLEELEVLHVDRLVQAERLGQGRARGRRGPLAEDRRDHPAGEGAEPEEQQEGEDEHHSDHLDQSSDDESRQGRLLAAP